jgi:2-polyprenyl-6-hydroxyphenyl methylase / 3-demethylubiquinone-9 3-methyltransferase
VQKLEKCHIILTMNTTIDEQDISRFAKLADEWWNPNGAFKILHQINPLRVQYIRSQAINHFNLPDDFAPLKGLKLLDIGCGGGLIAEAMARLGAEVTAIDATEKNILTAQAHLHKSGLNVNYRFATAEELAAEGSQFDIVLALEVIEHVSDVDFFLKQLATLTNPNGVLIISTLNRTLKSLLLAKIAAEYILGWVPKGTHDWNQFLLPSEIATPLNELGCTKTDLTGMVYKPLANRWELSAKDIDINYLLSFKRN